MSTQQALITQSRTLRIVETEHRRTVTDTIRDSLNRMAGAAVVRLGKVTGSLIVRQELVDFFHQASEGINYRSKFPYVIKGTLSFGYGGKRPMEFVLDRIKVEEDSETYHLKWVVN